LTVVLNLTDAPRRVSGAGPGRVLIGTHRDREATTVGETVELRPNEALVVEATGRGTRRTSTRATGASREHDDDDREGWDASP
jgi:hypothetical protein